MANPTVQDPTYYGPAQTQGSSSATIDTQTTGALNQIYQQPCENSPSLNSDGTATLREQFKGPYASLKEILAKFSVGMTHADFISGLDSMKAHISRFSVPTPHSGKEWRLKSVAVRELEAGDHATLDAEFEETPRDDDVTTTWSLNWQPYDVNPYAFCGNEYFTPPDADVPLSALESFDECTACRSHIEAFLETTAGDRTLYQYRQSDSSQLFQLTRPERLVADKVLKGKHAVWHYPVLTKTSQQTRYVTPELSNVSELKYDGVVGQDIDHILSGSVSQLSCPYEFPTYEVSSGGRTEKREVWTWTKTGDQMSQQKTKNSVNFTRTETWWGTVDPDINFYGNTPYDEDHRESLSAMRWELGKI